MGLEHAAVLAEVHRQCFTDTGGLGEPWDARAMTDTLSMPGVAAFFARIDEKAAGLVIARLAGDEAEILTLAVVPELRRKGLGAALLQGAIHWAADCGARQMFLEVSEDNTAARGLYRRFEFAEAGYRRAYYRVRTPRNAANSAAVVSAVVMCLGLAAPANGKMGSDH